MRSGVKMEARAPVLRKLRVADPKLRRFNTLEAEVISQAIEKYLLGLFRSQLVESQCMTAMGSGCLDNQKHENKAKAEKIAA